VPRRNASAREILFRLKVPLRTPSNLECVREASSVYIGRQGSGVFRTYPVLLSMWGLTLPSTTPELQGMVMPLTAARLRP
jgi:hypothetical protein